MVGDNLISKFDGEVVGIDWERKRSVGKADEYVKTYNVYWLKLPKNKELF